MAKQFKPETLCVQAGWTPKKGEPRVLPIYQSTTFKYDTSEQMARLFDLEDSGYFYTRLQNPTNDAVAAKIAALEGGVAAMLTSSGQAANFYAIFNICQAGDHFVCSSAIYGGTFNLFGVTMKKLGIDVTFIHPDASEEEISAAFKPNTKALFGETISNPSLEVLDIEKFARIAHSHGVPLIVDNTFPTPINCRPFEWGADIVVHSTTKYMDGHATSVGGCIVDSGNFDWDAHAEKFPGLPPVSFAIVGEPTEMQPAIAEKGLMVLDVTATGKAGHAARNEGDNAIYKVLDDIAWFRDYRFEKESPLLGPVKMSVTVINAGTQHNVIPDKCTFIVDVRSNELYSNEELFAEIKKHISCEAQARSFRLNSSRIDEKHPFVQKAMKLGRVPFGSPTLSDQALMSFPSVKIGPGRSSRSHTAEEYIMLKEIEEAIGLYLELLDGLLI